jgi:PAS domain S-box-containing protein
MVIVNEAGRIVLLNEQAETLFGYQRQELLDRPVEILMPEAVGALHGSHRGAFVRDPRRRPMGGNRDLWARHKDGHAFNVEISLSPLETSEGLLISSAIRDVTARKAAEELAARLAAVVESSDDAIFSKTPEGIIQTWNRAAERVFGYRANEIIGRSALQLVPDELHGEDVMLLDRLRRGEKVESYETRRRRQDSTTFDVALTISSVADKRGGIIAVSTIARDVTDRKTADRRIRASLEEKETMLREIHHRVKNNLAVISSLFYLDSTYPHDPESRRSLQEARDRVLSMAMVHETLYRSADFAHLDFGVYVKRLLGHLLRSHGTRAGVLTRTQVDEITMTLDTAMPCALVINELVTNCLKHAFPDHGSGEVHIAVQRDNCRCTLRVADTGVGVPATLDPTTTRSLGLRLVRSLAAQLEGEFTIRNTNPGTEATLSFPMEGGVVHIQ